MGIAAGTLNKRLILQRAVTSPNDLGEPVETWVTVKEVAAAKMNLPGEERLRAAEMAAAQPLRFKFRWAPEWADFDTTWRVVYRGRTYNVQDSQEVDADVGERPEGFEIRAIARAEAI